MTKRLMALLLLALTAMVGVEPAVAIELRRVSFNEGWKFMRGELPGAEQIRFDDSQWESVRLPHD